MRTSLNILITFFLSIIIVACEDSKTNQKPNVILIYADDLGRGLLSHEGQEIIKTPNIDKLAASGIRFENAYGSMLCAPARASLITGYHDCHGDKWEISRAGLYSDITRGKYTRDQVENAYDKQAREVPDNEVFLAEVFKKAGYETAQIGKLDWGFATTHKQLERHGWDYYYGYYDHQRCHGFYPPFLFENDKMVMIEGNTRADCGKTAEWDKNGGYEGGKSIIEATSEGLEPARIEITTTGEPKFIEGKTPVVKNRPYIDYSLTKDIEVGEAVKISYARPTRTNSKSNSLPSLANDGHKWTKWQPGLENESVWWELDMENFYDVDRVEITFVSKDDFNLTIETSLNKKEWNEVAKGEYITGSIPQVIFQIKDNSEVRFLRVHFSEKKENTSVVIGEIEVFGKTN